MTRGIANFEPGYWWWCCDGGELPLGHCETADEAQQALAELMTLSDGTEDWTGWRFERSGGPTPDTVPSTASGAT